MSPARANRVSAALVAVEATAADLGVVLTPELRALCADRLRSAGVDLLRGVGAAPALRLAWEQAPTPHDWAVESILLDLLAALAGSLLAFDALPVDRRVAVLRYALAVVAQGTEAWGPLATVSPRHDIRIGEAWADVAALARSRTRAA